MTATTLTFTRRIQRHKHIVMAHLPRANRGDWQNSEKSETQRKGCQYQNETRKKSTPYDPDRNINVSIYEPDAFTLLLHSEFSLCRVTRSKNKTGIQRDRS